MGVLTEAIVGAGLQDRILSEAQLSRLLAGSAQRRYNLVNRALRSGELMRLRRGRYRLAGSVNRRLPHPFVVAQALVAGSYVSLESALSYEGWIPEAVPSTLSIVPGRRGGEVQVPGLGQFRFSPLALNRGFFLEAVDRVLVDGQAALVAQPLRALLDRWCLRKQDWPGLAGLAQDMRIDPDALATLSPEALEPLRSVYRHGRMRSAIEAMQRELAA
jgi:predicted transcriptional regulator of viral defense system